MPGLLLFSMHNCIGQPAQEGNTKVFQRARGAKGALVVRLLRWAVMSAVFVPLVVRQVQRVNNVQFAPLAGVRPLEAACAQFVDLEPRPHLRAKRAWCAQPENLPQRAAGSASNVRAALTPTATAGLA